MNIDFNKLKPQRVKQTKKNIFMKFYSIWSEFVYVKPLFMFI